MTVAVIGGSGFHDWEAFVPGDAVDVPTPYGNDVTLRFGTLNGSGLLFLPRHGPGHSVPPHRINYRANIWALRETGVHAVLAIATVGGITAGATAGSLMIPDQVLDYTWGRAHTFFDGEDGGVGHVDMMEPYCGKLRDHLIRAAGQCGIILAERGTYAATQGPRFETPAEIRRLERDGADIVGMTGMPEAALARELQLPYAAIALVANPAAGTAAGGITMEEIGRALEAARSDTEKLLAAAIPGIENDTFSLSAPLRP